MEKSDKIKELLQLEDIYIGTLEIFPDFGFGGSIIGNTYCLYLSGFEKENKSYNPNLFFPFNKKTFRPEDGRLNIIDGDRLVIFSIDGLSIEKDLFVDIEGYYNDRSRESMSRGLTKAELDLYFNEERKAKIYRKKKRD